MNDELKRAKLIAFSSVGIRRWTHVHYCRKRRRL